MTYLYDDGTKVAGNAVRLKVPDKDEANPEPTPDPSDETYASSTISGSANDTTVNLSWEQIDHSLFSGYKVVASKTNPNPSYPNDGYLKYITNAGTTSYSFNVSEFDAGETYYFSITVLYSDGTKKAGNAVSITMPEDTGDPEEPYISSTISGSANETTVYLSWEQIDHSLFSGYKVVASKTNPNPSYPADGYLRYITNAGTTSCSFDISQFDAGETYYFSITVLYNDGTKIAGNAIAITMPEEEPEPSG